MESNASSVAMPDDDDADNGEFALSGPVLRETVDAMLDVVANVDRMISGLMAVRAEAIDATRVASELAAHGTSAAAGGTSSLAHRSVRAEISCAMRVPERTVEALMGVSDALVHDLPATLRALRTGEITYRHAQVMVAGSAGLESATLNALEAEALRYARNLTAAKFERKLRVLRERIHPEPLEERHLAASVERDVEFTASRDGMAWIGSFTDAVSALAIYEKVGVIAASIAGPDECRTLAQLKADVFCELLLIPGCGEASIPDCAGETTETGGGEISIDSSGRFRNIRPHVFVTVPVMTLLGRSDEPAILDGYGPIDPATAMELAAHAPSFTRILTHPETGAVLSIGRDSYAVPKDLRRWLRVRDGTCRFVNCSRDAAHCDIDHTKEWVADNGPTAHNNLAYLCRGHHTVKGKTAWQVEQTEDGSGTLEWTSPSGRTYTTLPDTIIGTAAPDPPPF